MNKASILGLVRALANTALDESTLDAYFSDVLYELGRSPRPLVEAELFAVASGTAGYSFPANAVTLLHAFFGSAQLSPSDKASLEAYSSTWRSDSGTPFAYTVDEQTGRAFRLYPTPSASSAALSFPTGTPFGVDFPSNAGCLIFSSARTEDIQPWVGYAIALKVLAKEFAKPTNKQDVDFADACNQLAEVFLLAAGEGS